MTDTKTDNGLRLLNDSVYDPIIDKDAFNHKIYAKLLTKIFNPKSQNDPGISVALFGKWGQGKSSVVQMMESELAENKSDNKVKVIWFNAWKTRGDHVRRQLLLSIIKGIDSPKYEDISKFVQPGNPVTIRKYSIQKNINQKTHWWIMSQDEKLDPIIIAAIIAGLLALILFVSFFILSLNSEKNWLEFILPILLTFIVSCMTVTYRWFCNRKESILTSAEPVSDSQRLKYPDQFQLVFEEELAEYKERDGTPIVVVVDDLDRCEASTVVEALACIRQLGGKPLYEEEIAECRFLIPCDEEQVLSALKEDGHHDGYEKEDLLRKFFDVIVRMDAFLPDDMVAYARALLNNFANVEESDIELIQELIGAVAPRNPRQVKKLVNAFLIFKEKVKLSQESFTLRTKEKLDHFDNTGLLVIALQETVPELYKKLVDLPNEFTKLHDLSNGETDTNLDEADKKATRIIRALEPISHHTFNMFTRKGIPKSLMGIENGPDIYDAIQSGNEETFEKEIAVVSDLNSVAIWLKEHRKSLASIAQFRNALSCLIKPSPLPELLNNTINDYIRGFKRFKDAAKGYKDLIRLSKIAVELGPCKRKIHSTVISNFRELKTDDALSSDELKSIFIFGDDLSDSAEKLFTQHVCPMFHLPSEEPTEEGNAVKHLTALSNALPGNKPLNIPELAITIAKESTWEIYNTNDPEKNIELHSKLINFFIGDKEEDVSKLIAILFEGSGPLGQKIDLKTASRNGEREGILTITALTSKLSSDQLQKLYLKVKPWLDIQADPENFMFVASVFSTQWPRLAEKQINEIAALMTAHSINNNKPNWLCEYVKCADQTLDETIASEKIFCKAAFNNLKQTHLNQPTISELASKFLFAFKEHSWPITKEADETLANAVRTNITNGNHWEIWRKSLWPLAIAEPTQTTAAVYEQLANNKFPETYIPFAVEEICSGKLSASLKPAVKQYFSTNPNSINDAYFKSLFSDGNVAGAEQVIEMVVDDLDSAKTPLDEQRIEFISNNLKGVREETIKLFFKYIRRQYLQEANLAKFYIGVKYAINVGNIPKEIKSIIKERALEQSANLTVEQKDLTVKVTGKNLFEEDAS